LALFVRDSLADLTGLVGANFMWTSGANFTGLGGALFGWERVTLLLVAQSAILLGILFAMFLINANRLGNVMANLFFLVAALFPWNVLASLGRFISANLMRDFAADFGWFVHADSLVVDSGSLDRLELLGQLLGVQLLLLFVNFLNDLLLDGALGNLVLLLGNLVLLLGQLVRQLVNLAAQFGTDLGVEINQLLTILGNLAMIFAVELGVELLNLGGKFAVDLVNLVDDLILDLAQLVANFALDETNLLQKLVLQRLAFPDRLHGLVDNEGKGLSERNRNLTADLFGGGGTYLRILGAADSFIGNGAPSVLISSANLAWMRFALSLANGFTLGFVLAKLLPHHITVRDRNGGALVLHGEATALPILHATFTLLNGGARPEVLG